MSQGSLRCIGTSAHLKNKYGKGYTLSVNSLLASTPEEELDNSRRLDEFVIGTIARSQGSLLSSINRAKKYLIPKTAPDGTIISVSEIFKLMECNKTALHVREWGLSMATLEEVFISAIDDTPQLNY